MQQDNETIEHLLGVVVENREKRCQQIREKAQQQAREITRQAHARSRARMHSHVNELREKYRNRIASANARNQTLLRQQHQKEDRAMLDVAWPMLRDAMTALWNGTESRHAWLQAAIAIATSRLRGHDWHIEHPPGLSEADQKLITRTLAHSKSKHPKLAAVDDIEVGIRIKIKGTVVDATLEGLLSQRKAIEANMLARIKQGAANHD
jgi:vacuolar-type H+-ATPase subunit E/Vma4